MVEVRRIWPSRWDWRRGNGVSGQHGRLRTRCRGLIGACNWDVAELTGEKLDLAMTDMTWQVGDAGEFENPTEERMSGVGDRDLAFAFLCNQRGITLAVVCPSQGCR
jgi:hypothetical protein